MSEGKGIKVFSGGSNLDLSLEIVRYLGCSLGEMEVASFSDGETRVKISENVRGYDVFIVQPTCPPVNHNLMELLVMIDAVRRSSAHRITAVLPYYGYARQDRKDQPRVPISAKLVANLLVQAGVDRVLSLDLHADQIQGFFDKPLDHLNSVPEFSRFILDKPWDNLVVCSVDVGGIKRARALSQRLGVALAVVDKRRLDHCSTEVVNVLGDVEGKNVVFFDDMISTGGSLVTAAQSVVEKGASSVRAFASHGLFASGAIQRIEESLLDEIYVTNTIPLVEGESVSTKIHRVSIANLLGEAIRRIHHEESVNFLFQ